MEWVKLLLLIIVLLILFLIASFAPWCLIGIAIVLVFALVVKLLPYGAHYRITEISARKRMERGEITQQEYEDELKRFERWNKK